MPEKKVNRIIIDTNLFISFLIGKKLKGLKDLIVNSKIRLLFTHQTIQEIQIVTKRSKLKKYFKQKDINDLIDLIQTIGEFVIVYSEPKICRDPKDNFLLGLADKGKANYLVTGDHDLLELRQYKSTKIITYIKFEEIMLGT
ncbi:MAG: putative toxin-antitoxin system toxin component, PIN family [Bacteroidales bacterium]|nr:putative toxin-antitoxin system toxin component, PIN family [Bacteroidales bacterium]